MKTLMYNKKEREGKYTELKGLIDGKNYITREIKTPFGYTTMDDMEFTFSEGMKLDIKNSRPEIETFVSDEQPTVFDSATDENIAAADSEVRLIDTVGYKNLDPKKVYVLESSMVNKNTGEVFVAEDGTQLTVQTAFQPTAKDGKVKVEFPAFNGTCLTELQLVAYEELCEDDGTVVAEHKDIDDTAQTITLLNEAAPLPDDYNEEDIAETGDNMKLKLLILLMNISLAGVLGIIALKLRKNRSSKRL